MTADETRLMTALKKGDKSAFRAIYEQYYRYLVVSAFNVLGDRDVARDLAQDVFVEIWKKREAIQIRSGLKPYLRRAVVNKTLNYIKARRINFDDPDNLPEMTSTLDAADETVEASEMEKIIHAAIARLPERCRVVFTLCRLEKMSHKEISAQLGISTKTVEAQMTRALSTLRKAIAPFQTLAIGLLFLELFFRG